MKRLVLLLVLLALAPASAQAITFGADLNARPANYVLGCDQYPIFGTVQNTGATSCSWFSSPMTTTSTESFVAPQSGTVTRVRIKVGPTTGPMQIAVFRTIRPAQLGGDPMNPGNAQAKCCFIQSVTPTFTPARNTVTALDVNLPMSVDTAPDATNQLKFDAIGLSVLAPQVPIPAHAEQAEQTAASRFYAPAWQANTERVSSDVVSGLQMLISADLTPTAAGGGGGTGGGGGGGGGPGAPTPGAALNATTAKVKKGRALVDLVCNGSAACEGQLALINRGAVTAQRKKSSTTVYGKAQYKIPAGQKKSVKVKLGGKAKRLLKKKKSVKLGVRITPKGGTATTGRLTLKR